MEKVTEKVTGDVTTLSDLENKVAILSRRKRTETAILGTIAITGFLAACLVAPNAVRVLQYAVPDTSPLSHKQSVQRAIGRLIKNKYIEKNGKKYKLTAQGELRLQNMLAAAHITNKQNEIKQKWDGKWRIVIFDIKESRRHVRDELRSLLTQTGFVKLQDSVWVYPFRCDEVVALLKFKLTLGWNLIYIIADAIEGDSALLKHFHIRKK